MKKNFLIMLFLLFLAGCGSFYDGLMTQCHYVVVDGTDENGQLACKGINKFTPPDYKSTDMEYYSPDGKSISEEEFHKKKYGELVDKWVHDMWVEKYKE